MFFGRLLGVEPLALLIWLFLKRWSEGESI
jgi:hypothetical protein